MKRLFLLSIVASLCASGFTSADAFGEYQYSNNGNGTCTITGYTGPGKDITIPDTLGGLTVTSIGDRAFDSCTSLTSVVIGNSVTSIGGRAFYYCTSLTAITVDANNPAYTSADGVLFNKSQTTLIQYPAGLSGSYAIPDSVTSIGQDAFTFCTSLTSVIIPDSVTSIGHDAFTYCTSLTSVIIGDSVTGIGYRAFFSCTSLTSVVIGDSVIYIGESAFWGCRSLTSVVIGDSVTYIGDFAFRSCTSLTSVIIPDSVTYIGDGAFYSCTSLTSVMIPDSVTSIGNHAFRSCANLTGIVIPDSVTSIGGGAFYYCTSLTGIVIPDSVTSIGGGAFYYCTSLTSVVIGNSVTSIGDGAFAVCTSLICIFFKGIPPALWGYDQFLGCQATVYYLARNAASWPATFAGRPTAPWQLSIADLNQDGNVDFMDFLAFAAAWQTVSGVDAAYNGECDLAEPFGIIDIADLQLLANEWLITPCQSQ